MRHNLVLSYNWSIPFDRAFGSRRLTTGWHLTGISRFSSGLPISLKSGGDYALTNIGLDYPNQVGSVQKIDPHQFQVLGSNPNPGNYYFNPSAFARNIVSCGGNPAYEACGVTGSAKQYSFYGPRDITTDLGVEKDTKLTESTALNFRFELFNAFNHTNFLSSGISGDANSSQFGQATTAAQGRVGQISAKFIF
jgi:hypothetical protein